jgi:hypothetical protein
MEEEEDWSKRRTGVGPGVPGDTGWGWSWWSWGWLWMSWKRSCGPRNGPVVLGMVLVVPWTVLMALGMVLVVLGTVLLVLGNYQDHPLDHQDHAQDHAQDPPQDPVTTSTIPGDYLEGLCTQLELDLCRDFSEATRPGRRCLCRVLLLLRWLRPILLLWLPRSCRLICVCLVSSPPSLLRFFL